MHLTGTLFALIALHGLVLTGVLLNSRWTGSLSMRILAVLTATVTILASDIVLSIAGVTQRFPHFLGVTVPVWYVVAPTLYLHVRTFTAERDPGLRIRDISHLIPAAIATAAMTSFFLLPPNEKIQLAQTVPLPGGDAVRHQVFLLGYSFQMIVYAILSWKTIARYDRTMTSEHTHAAIHRIQWLKRLLLLLALYVVLDGVVALAYAMQATPSPALFSFTTLLALSGTVYALGYTMILQPDLLWLGVSPENGSKYEKSALDPRSRQRYAAQLDFLMRNEHLYRTPDLRLTEVAVRIGVSRHHLSQTVNQEFGLSFFDFINRWRIAEAAERLRNGDAQRVTVLAIAHDAGFNSSASFYRMFNRYIGIPPGKFVEQRGKGSPELRPLAPTADHKKLTQLGG